MAASEVGGAFRGCVEESLPLLWLYNCQLFMFHLLERLELQRTVAPKNKFGDGFGLPVASSVQSFVSTLLPPLS